MINILKTAELIVHKTARVVFGIIGKIFIPLRKNRITLMVTRRKGFSCNVKYVAKAIKEKYGDKYELAWISDYPETCDDVRKFGIKVKKVHRLPYVFYQLGSKFVVYNDAIPSYMPKRKGQIYINTWHGAINYKHIGYDYEVELEKFALRNPQPDYITSGCRFFTEDAAKSFRFDEKVFLPWGIARNALLFDEKGKEEAREKVRKTYGINDEKILLYAPTFRIGFAADAHGLDFGKVADAMKKRFGGDWKIFYRGHGFVEGDPKIGEFVVDATSYADMSELTAAADGMISDYSSAMWDMIFTGKPIFAYVPDIKRYADEERDFAYPVEKWPYPKAETNDELVEKILNFDENEFNKGIKKHLEDAGSYEDGGCAEKVAELINESA